MGQQCCQTCNKTTDEEKREILVPDQIIAQTVSIYNENSSSEFKQSVILLSKDEQYEEQPENAFPIESIKIPKQIEEYLSTLPEFNYQMNTRGQYLGAFLLKDNSQYDGEWHKSMRHGKGRCVFPNLVYYEGSWKEDKIDGYGRLIHPEHEYYEGLFTNGLKNGKGRVTQNNGAYFEGEFVYDKKHGYGIEVWPDGQQYEGQYFNGSKEGRGIFTWANGDTYEGEFKDNKMEDKEYEGEWKDSKMNGQGEFRWNDGRKYIGSYKNDKKDGYGEFNWPDGKYYKGQWKDGKQHGIALYKGKDMPNERQCYFEEGKRTKWIE
ncbi:unnamed protein product [Paramecium pentaurelia]|uniref:MORN repeat protein n=1 Tax=Paramecium pentaurelia TaxID=43138 RepID=A0A8S1VS47_9CILI|nr:unnamed protein product [Paramecium pentaurelia]